MEVRRIFKAVQNLIVLRNFRKFNNALEISGNFRKFLKSAIILSHKTNIGNRQDIYLLCFFITNAKKLAFFAHRLFLKNFSLQNFHIFYLLAKCLTTV